MKIDRYGRGWPDDFELCAECGQPDNCGDCNHGVLLPEEVESLGGTVYLDPGHKRKVEAYDAARAVVKTEGNSRAYYVLRTQHAEEEVARLREGIEGLASQVAASWVEDALRALLESERIEGAPSD